MDIAVIGMACRFPDAPSLAQYWRNIVGKRVSFRPIDDSRWTHSRILSDSTRDADKTYTKNGAFIDDIDAFAAMRFNIPPRRAEAMDPQQRLFLECVNEAMEDAGLHVKPYDKTQTGVIVGASVSEHKDLATSRARIEMMMNGEFGSAGVEGPDRAKLLDRVQPMRAFTVAGNLLNMNAAVVAQALDITGPAFAIDAACASGLAAIVQSVQALRNGRTATGEVAPVMLAGGVYLNLLPDNWIGFSRVGAMAREVCRPFDAQATGFIMGEGVGAVVLKRLEDAERDGDRVYAVIRGAAVNSDGRGDGPMAPRRAGQVALLRAGLADARVSADSIEYIEAHGTGTAVGDKTELEAWGEVLGDSKQLRRIGSMKANIGHTMSAAGVAGFIRAALSVYHRMTPPQAGFDKWHPQLEALSSRFSVETEVGSYSAERPLATVSAFGFGGTNAFCVLEGRDTPPVISRGAELFIVSAATPELVVAYANALAEDVPADLTALSYTLLCERPLEGYAACFVADAVSFKTKASAVKPIAVTQRPVVALFAGQGAQAPDAFKTIVSRYPRLGALIRELAEPGHYDLLFPADKDAAAKRLQETDVTQPALAALQLGVFAWLSELGVRFDATLGHSLGEFIAASASGRLDAKKCVEFVAQRGHAMAAGERSGMVAVKADAEKARAIAKRFGLEVANFNHPEQTVLGGANDAVDRAVETLKAEKVACAKLQVSHAFHTSFMRPAARAVADLVDALPLEDAKTMTLFSCVDAVQAPSTANQLKRVWREHAVRSVLFEGTVRAVNEAHPDALYLQLGPGHALSQATASTLHGVRALTLGTSGKELEQALLALGELVLSGQTLRLEALFGVQKRALSVPPRPLVREKYWVISRRDTPSKASVSVGETVASAEIEKLVAKQLELMEQQNALMARMLGQQPSAQTVAPTPVEQTPVAAPTPVETPLAPAVYAAIAKVSAFPEASLKSEHNLVQDLGFDSLMMVELASTLRDTLGKEVAREVWAEGPSIARVIEALGETPAPVEVSKSDAPVKRFARAWKPSESHSHSSTQSVTKVIWNPSLLDVAHNLDAAVVFAEHTPSALEAAVRCLQQERPDATIRYVLASKDTLDATVAAEAGNADPVVRLTATSREVPSFEELPRKPASKRWQAGDTVVITGGGSGVGLALAHAFAKEGLELVILGRKAQLAAGAPKARYFQCDVTNGAALQAVLTQLKGVRGLVHAAGVSKDMRADKLDAATLATIRATKAQALQTLVAGLPDLGWVLATSSWAGVFGNHGQLAYAAANAEMDLLIEKLPVKALSVQYPPWRDTGLARGISQATWHALGIRPLDADAAVAATLLALQSEGPKTALLGYELPNTYVVEALPYINDHKVKDTPRLPLAQALAWFTRGQAVTLKDVHVRRPVQAPGRVRVVRNGEHVAVDREGAPGHAIDAKLAPVPTQLLEEPPSCIWFDDVPLAIDTFYAQHAFHGPKLQAITRVLRAADTALEGEVKRGPDNVLGIDGSFQLALFWAQLTQGKVALPTQIDEAVWLKPWTSETIRCRLDLSEITEHEIVGTIRYYEGAKLIGWLRNIRARLLQPDQIGIRAFKQSEVPEEFYKIEATEAYQDLRQRLDMAAMSGLKNPYFTLHEQLTTNKSVIGGREMLNYSSYNYVGLSGHPVVSKAAADAITRYGTSVSASRVASGEKPLHRELEAAISRFVGTEDAIVMVGGHSTNVGTIGHLLGPGDLILHDSLIHDSALQGAKLSGAQRRPFPHNDHQALDKMLAMMRSKYKRVLIVIEGAYSMDGDLPELPAFIALRNRYKCWLMVDEAHSLGVLGEGGRGIGEHFNVNRAHVDLWMGTLSKSLSSCGGYIAGSKAMVEYLKYTSPSFVYSVGISPPNAAAALASIEVLEKEPERVTTLHARSRFFLAKAKEHGLDTGMSEHSAVVPVIVGNSFVCLKLSQALFDRGINVNPIIYPAVEDNAARLRFFVTALHSEAEIEHTARVTAQCLQEIRAELEQSLSS